MNFFPEALVETLCYEHPKPYADFGKGCTLTDLDGVTRIDFSNNMASLLHGHADPDIVSAVTEQLKRGTAFTMATEIEVQYAEFLCERSPSFEKLRFVKLWHRSCDDRIESIASIYR